jgi:RNA polymerase sigma-70 factor (ECF subfamily)
VLVASAISAPDAWIAWLIEADESVAAGGASREALVVRAQSGDPEAFEMLVRAAGDRLLGIARKILRDPDAAEDALQQAVITAWRTLPRLRDPGRFDAWMYRLLVRACYAESRDARRRFAGHVRELSGEPAGEDATEAVARRDLLETAFRSLSPAHRAVVVLHVYADLPLIEVATITGTGASTVRSRLHYALRSLRAAIDAAERPVIEEFVR